METVSQENSVVEAPKTFTQEEVNAIIGERLVREREKYADYDALKEKAGKFDQIEEANKTELQKANEKAATLQSELDSIKKANEVRDIREKVATEVGIPSNLLSGTTEEDCLAQAKALMEFKNGGSSSGYPSVKDGGEVHSVGKRSTREQFAEWANSAFN